MSTLGSGTGFIIKKEEKDLNLLGRAELVSKVAAGVLALTYVSGYLISTTYLATYGISADASGFLRAKYIYIGCQYWMFVACFGVMARFISMVLDTPWASPKTPPPGKASDTSISSAKTVQNNLGNHSGPKNRRLKYRWGWDPLAGWNPHLKGYPKDSEESRAFKDVNAKLDERSSPNHPGTSSRNLRWVLVVGLILSVFALEIMLLGPGNFTTYLPLQALFLVSISLYQTTYYLEYSRKYQYSWGVLHGHTIVDKMRWAFGVCIPAIFCCLMLGSALASTSIIQSIRESGWPLRWIGWLFSWFYSRACYISSSPVVFWLLGGFCIAAVTLAGSLVTMSTDNLRRLELSSAKRRMLQIALRLWLIGWIPLTNIKTRGMRWAEIVKSFGFVFVPGLYTFLALKLLRNPHSYLLVSGLYYVTLIWSLTVLSNIVTLTLMHREMHQQLGRPYPIPWKNMVVTCVAVTVLYVVSVFSFCFLVYPFIPSQRAGGRYTSGNQVIVDPARSGAECSLASNDVFTKWTRNAASTKHDDASTAPTFIVLEEDTNWTYLAPYKEGSDDDPARWAQRAFCTEKYQNSKAMCRPRVYAVNRRCIAYTENPPIAASGPAAMKKQGN